MNTSIRFLLPMAVATTLVLSACGTSTPPAAERPTDVPPPAANSQTQTDQSRDSADDSSPAATEKPSEQPGASAHGSLSNLISPRGVAAIDAALAAQPGTLVGLDTSDDNGDEWDVDILPDGAARPIEVKVKNGTVVSVEPDTDDDESLNLNGVTVTMEQAIQKAMTSTPGRFDSIDLDMHSGTTPTWEIDIDDLNSDRDHKIHINAVSGAESHTTD